MPCRVAAHFPIDGMGICPTGHVNRFCSACYSKATSTPRVCRLCGGALELTNDEPVMRQHSLREYNERVQANARAASSSSALMVPSSVAAACSVDEDIVGDRWKDLRKVQEERLKLKDIRLYPSSLGSAFRLKYGIRYPREAGYRTGDVARRVAFRVKPDDGKVTHWAHKFPPIQEVSPVNRGDTVGTLQPAKFRVGYVAMVPLPISLVDAVGNDRHPLKLAEMYADMFASRDLAWRRLRVLLAVNLRDDYRNLGDTTDRATKFLAAYTVTLNAAFLAHDLPARAIAVLWGLQVVKPTASKHGVTAKTGDPVIYLDNKPVDLSTEELRIELARLGKRDGETLKATEFPFATFRSLLVQSSEATRMITELKEWNEHIFLHTGDGDAVSLEPVKRKSLFQMFDHKFEQMRGATIERTARIGGCTQFDDKEVRGLIQRLGITDDSKLALTKSVLLTLLAKTLDSCVRGVMGQAVPHAGYFAEPNTLLNSRLIEAIKLGNISNQNNAEMPDWASVITKRIANGNLTDQIVPELAFQMTTSARAALVVISDQTVGADTETICVGSAWSEAKILRAFCGEHNTQLKPSQVNCRLIESKTFIPVQGRIESFLPARAAYPEALPIQNLPGAALQAVWDGRNEEAVCAALRGGNLISGMLPKPGASAKELTDLLYSFPNEVDLIPSWGIVGDMRARLNHCLCADKQYQEGAEDYPVYDALLHIDAVLHWAIAMVSRIMQLKE
jgi:hypothetical protein